MKKNILFISILLLWYFHSNAADGDFRTKASGNWNSVSTWQRHNGSTWVDATYTPSYTDQDITILAGYSVTITDPVTVDQVNVKGTLTLNSGVTLTVNDGTGTDISVSNTSSNYSNRYGVSSPPLAA